LDYFSSQLPDKGTSDQKKSDKKQGWMDRLAGVDPNSTSSKKTIGPRFQLLNPYGVAVDSKGLLYIADAKVGAIFIFNTETDDVTLIKNGIDAHFKLVMGLAMDDSDHLFATDSGKHEVMEFDASHKFVGSFGSLELRNPCGIALDLENRYLYVADADLDQVIVFDADTHAVLRRLGTTGKNHTLTDAGNFSKPTNVAVGKDGDVFITDTLNDRVEVFDADGLFVRTFGKNGDCAGCFARPKGIATDSDGHVWVVDAMLNRVQVFTPEGDILLAFGSYGVQPAEFQALTGIGFDAKRNRMFTTEQMFGRAQMFRYYTDAEALAELKKREAGKKPAENSKAAGNVPAAAPASAPAAVSAAPSATTSPAASAAPEAAPESKATGAFSKIPSSVGAAPVKP
jgi:DNA-binding beta-propeller fold protein YncE